MADIMTVKQAAEKWGISARRVNELILKGQIKKAYKAGNTWVMPDNTEKPADGRVKHGKYIGEKAKYMERNARQAAKNQQPADNDAISPALTDSFQKLFASQEMAFQMFDMFPIPIEVFAPDGTAVYANRAGLEFNNIPDASLLVGKYNILNDPMLTEYQEVFQKAFRGEKVCSPLKPPVQDLVNRGVAKEKPFESADMLVYFYPVWNVNALVYVVTVFIIRSVYQGKPDTVKVKAYLESHWREKYDPNAAAKVVNMSLSRLQSLFKQHTGMTMFDYYKKCKVDHIREKLAEKALSIKEAFAACGEDSRGAYAKVFKEITGMSPKEYRESI